MNFLAHIYLASKTDHSIVGSILPDLCKPNEWRLLDDKIIKGCLMHQRVDKLTDNHPSFVLLKNTISDKRRRFAGIILDVAFDHILAKNWSQWHTESLELFTQDCNIHLLSEINNLSKPGQKVLNAMVQGNWLYGYQHIEGIARAFSGLSRRFRFENPLAGSEEELLENMELWSQEFEKVMNDLIIHNYSDLA